MVLSTLERIVADATPVPGQSGRQPMLQRPRDTYSKSQNRPHSVPVCAQANSAHHLTSAHRHIMTVNETEMADSRVDPASDSASSWAWVGGKATLHIILLKRLYTYMMIIGLTSMPVSGTECG